MTENTSELRQSYEIVSVRRTDPPAGMEGSNWHSYVIAFQGSNSIRGCRQGTLSVVTGAVQEIVTRLNERHIGKYGRAHLAPTPKQKPANVERSKLS